MWGGHRSDYREASRSIIWRNNRLIVAESGSKAATMPDDHFLPLGYMCLFEPDAKCRTSTIYKTDWIEYYEKKNEKTIGIDCSFLQSQKKWFYASMPFPTTAWWMWDHRHFRSLEESSGEGQKQKVFFHYRTGWTGCLLNKARKKHSQVPFLSVTGFPDGNPVIKKKKPNDESWDAMQRRARGLTTSQIKQRKPHHSRTNEKVEITTHSQYAACDQLLW